MALYFEGSKSITLSHNKSLSFLSLCWLTHPSLRHYVPPPSASRVSHHTSLCPDDMHSPLPLLSTTGLAHCIKTPVQRGRLAWRSTVPVLCPSAPPSWGHNRGNDWVTEVVAQTPQRLLLRKKTRHAAFLVATHLQKVMELGVVLCHKLFTIQGELSVSTIGWMTEEVIVEVLPLQSDRILVA